MYYIQDAPIGSLAIVNTACIFLASLPEEEAGAKYGKRTFKRT